VKTFVSKDRKILIMMGLKMSYRYQKIDKNPQFFYQF